MVGKTLGHYRILASLGAGGMGEVYLGEDTRLDRKVAIKVLPAEYAGDPERLARFEQEARAAAALNHPHIAVLHDIGNDGGTHFMVQEYLEGKSLREVLTPGSLELRRSLGLGIEIAEALKAAHRSGIVHRDLKPENIFVTEDGHAKVLDFGLAKLTEVAAGPMTTESMSPTAFGTQAGVIMGTAGYMAPEQVQGQEVDARADVFAFGCVLWEMLCGRRAFSGKSVPHTLHKILDEEAAGRDAEATRELPLRLRWVLDRTLAKSPDDRAQSAADVLAELRLVASEVDSGTAISGPVGLDRDGDAAAAAERQSLSLATVAVVAALALLAGIALTWALKPTPAAPAGVPTRFFVDVADASADDFDRPPFQVLAISPDGEKIVFNRGDRLWLRRLGDPDAVELRGTALARSPTFSPDSRHVAFWADDQIKRVDLVGGTPINVGTSLGRAQGLSWADDGFIYLGGADGNNISRIPETGGQPEIVFDFLADSFSAYAPRLLPGGEWVLFTRVQGRAWNRAQLVVQSLNTQEARVLLDGQDGRYVSTGHLLYVRDGVLTAVRFDLGTLTVSGAPVPLLDDVRTAQAGVTGAAFYGFSDNGTLIYTRETSAGIFDLVWVDRDGNVEPLPIEPARFEPDIALSPDGARLVAAIPGDDGPHLWLYDVDRPGGQSLTDMVAGLPVWSPDGEWIYFAAISDADNDLWRRRADLSSQPERLLAADDYQGPSSISGDGEWLYYTNSVAGPPDIMRLNLRQAGDPEPVVATPSAEFDGRVSPDGRFVAFTALEAGSPGLYVQEIASGSRRLIAGYASAARGSGEYWAHTWSAATGELIFTRSGGLWAAGYTAEPDFVPQVPELLRPHPDRVIATRPALTAGGQRAVQLREILDPDAAIATPVRIEVVLNWFAELREAVPAAR